MPYTSTRLPHVHHLKHIRHSPNCELESLYAALLLLAVSLTQSYATWMCCAPTPSHCFLPTHPHLHCHMTTTISNGLALHRRGIGLVLQYCPDLTYSFSVAGTDDVFSLGMSCDTAMTLIPESQWTAPIPRPTGTYFFHPVVPLITGGQYCVYVRATGFKNVLEQAASNQNVKVREQVASTAICQPVCGHLGRRLVPASFIAKHCL